MSYVSAGLVIALVIAVAIAAKNYTTVKDMQGQVDNANATIANNTRTAYVATMAIKAGDPILDGVNVSMQSFVSGLSTDLYLTDLTVQTVSAPVTDESSAITSNPTDVTTDGTADGTTGDESVDGTYNSEDVDGTYNSADTATDPYASESTDTSVSNSSIGADATTGYDANATATYETASGAAVNYTVGSDQYVATTDIAANTPIMKSMVEQGMFNKDERSVEVAIAQLMTTQQNGDYVDVRVAFPDGSDYIVLSKKKITSLGLSNSVFTTYCDEADIERLASATLDAYLTAGARVYTTKYIESSLQDRAKETYPVKNATLQLLQQANNPNLNPNRVLSLAEASLNEQARLALEQRLGTITSDDLQKATDAINESRDKINSQIDALSQMESGNVDAANMNGDVDSTAAPTTDTQ